MVNEFNKEKFALNAGRPRPPYKPKDIHCPSCGAPLVQKDERSELVVCDYCGSHLDVSKEEKTVLGKGPDQKFEFPLNLGDSFYHKNARYEIIGRMVFIEDGDYSEMSRQYLLYNPYRGSLWLDEYKGQYSLSNDTHVMPKSDIFDLDEGQRMETHDNRRWIMDGDGVYELVYVDGALPWIARIGDRSNYVEFYDAGDEGLQYEVQRIENEIEYGMGQELSAEQLMTALGKVDRSVKEKVSHSIAPESDRKKRRPGPWFLNPVWLCFIFFFVNLLLGVYCEMQGTTVLKQKFTSDQVAQKVYSDTFTVKNKNDLIKINVKPTPTLYNSWVSVNIAILDDHKQLLHQIEDDIAYYRVGEDDTKGKTQTTNFVKIPKPGTYQLLLHAYSEYGENEKSQTAKHDIGIEVVSGALDSSIMFGISGICIFMMFFILILRFLGRLFLRGD